MAQQIVNEDDINEIQLNIYQNYNNYDDYDDVDDDDDDQNNKLRDGTESMGYHEFVKHKHMESIQKKAKKKQPKKIINKKIVTRIRESHKNNDYK